VARGKRSIIAKQIHQPVRVSPEEKMQGGRRRGGVTMWGRARGAHHSGSTPALEFKSPLIMRRDSLRVNLTINSINVSTPSTSIQDHV
jgi:hypothetical protein